MQGYNIDFTTALPKNTMLSNVPLASTRKGPVKPNTVTIYKDDHGRVYKNYENPVTLNIDNHKVKNVTKYNVINYRDKCTNNGKFYDISTPKSEISLYTNDGRFTHSWEHFHDRQTVNMNGKPAKGFLIKEVFSDGSQKHELITKTFQRKFMILDPDGHVVMPPKKSLAVVAERVVQTVKSLPKLLKFPNKLGIINLAKLIRK